MRLLLATASLVAQVVGLLALGFMMYDVFTLPDTLVAQAAGDTATFRQYILEAVVSYGPWIALGIAGAITMWLLMRRNRISDADHEEN